MAAAAASRHHEDVKVVLIDTQYVETDPLSFKSVVQKLTGKDSSVAWIEDQRSYSGANAIKTTQTKASIAVDGRAADHQMSYCGSTSAVGGGYTAGGGAMLSKGLSFKDLDRMIMEAPPVEELSWLWADY